MNRVQYINSIQKKANLNKEEKKELFVLLKKQSNNQDIMERINDLVKGYGVEFIRPKEDWNENNLTEWGVNYINEGDSYVPTAYFWRGRWWFGCIADHIMRVSFDVYA